MKVEPRVRGCAHRPHLPEVARCVACGMSLCERCAQRAQGRSWCSACRPTTDHRGGVRSAAAPAAAMLSLGIAALLGCFGASLALAWYGTQRQARADRETLARLRFALEDFYLDTSRYPTPGESFAALVSSDPDLDGLPIAEWRGPYLDLGRMDLRWSSRRGGLSDRRGNAILYYANPTEDWVYLASPGSNGRVDTAGLGGPEFGGMAESDDVVVWVEGP